jgi:hypothetical protein
MLEIMIKDLEIVEVSELLQHEQTIDRNLFRLKEAMLNIGQLVDPIIVDKKTKTVLDGNHRMRVLKTIKVPNAVCQAIDYNDERIKICGWFPVMENLSSAQISDAGFKVESVDFEQGKKTLDSKGAAFMLVKEKNGKECHLVEPSSYDLLGMLEAQSRILQKINNEDKIMYIADDQVNEHLKMGRSAFFRRNFTKQDVINEALAHRPLPPKSTRHLIPDRIIRLNMKLGWLHQTKEEATKYLEGIIHDRVYNSNVRRYTEPVIVIY